MRTHCPDLGRHVRTRYADLRAFPALRRLSRRAGLTFSIAAGEIFGFMGRSRAGKSTVVKMLTILLPPSADGAKVGGFDIVRDVAASTGSSATCRRRSRPLAT
ncbi:ATP-binding cassette domain-containing protein [Burkholderia ambifaria]|uniref:ATP-binding cassette domain-containing protein n=2 Tax=Burkholderia TaxID=32008 RepID=UPI0032422A26